LAGVPMTQIKGLPPHLAAVFGSWLVERMIRRFEIFCCETGHGGVSILKMALYQALSKLENRDASIELIESEVCYNLAPDSEEFSSIITSSAIDAANSAGLLIDYMKNGDINLICNIAELSIESVDMLIQYKMSKEIDLGDIETYIGNHKAMKEEVLIQENLVNTLSEMQINDDIHRMILCKSLEVRNNYPDVFM
jgi:uncharacterized protein YjaG (DUF416 family)